MIKVGDVVIPNPNDRFQDRFQLASGCGYYEFAICISIQPFILVSQHADMLICYGEQLLRINNIDLYRSVRLILMS